MPSRRVWPRPVSLRSNRGPEGEAGRPQEGQQDHQLREDAEGGPQAEQRLLAAGERRGLLGVGGRAEDHQVDHQDRDRDHVVGDRSPHHRPEPAAGVEDLAEQHEHAVEEHLRQAVAGEVDHRLPLRGQRRVVEARVEVERHHPGRRQHQQYRHQREEEHGGGDHAVGVRLAAVRVVPHRPNQLRDQDGVEDPARDEDVEHVRHGVADVEQVGVEHVAERGDEQGGAHEPAQPGDHRAGGHHRAGGEDPRFVGGLDGGLAHGVLMRPVPAVPAAPGVRRSRRTTGRPRCRGSTRSPDSPVPSAPGGWPWSPGASRPRR